MAKILNLGLCDLEDTAYFTPHNIVWDRMKELFIGAPESIKETARTLLSQGWKIYLVSQKRGRCYYMSKTITIPLWCLDSSKPGYKIWYIAHEFAHTFARGHNHDAKFMQELIRICPPEYVHYELGYKPRNAAAAGIEMPLDDLLGL